MRVAAFMRLRRLQIRGGEVHQAVSSVGRPALWLFLTLSWTGGTFLYMLQFEEWGRQEQFKAVPADIKAQKQRLCTQLQNSCLAMQATGQEVVNWCKQCLTAWS